MKYSRSQSRRAEGRNGERLVSYKPRSEADLVVLRSILDAERIPHFVHNDAFGTILVGPHIDHYNTKSIVVPDEAAKAAQAVIVEFEETEAERPAPTSLRDRVRMLAETVVFGWFVPGRYSRRGNGERSRHSCERRRPL